MNKDQKTKNKKNKTGKGQEFYNEEIAKEFTIDEKEKHYHFPNSQNQKAKELVQKGEEILAYKSKLKE